MKIEEIIDMVSNLVIVLGGYTLILGSLFAFLGTILINRVKEKDAALYKSELATLEKNLTAKINALNAKNESIAFVHKKQYEKEFSEYQSLWELSISVYLLFQKIESCEHTWDEFNSSISGYFEKYNELKLFVLNSRPFLYYEVQNGAKNLILKHQDTFDILINYLEQLSDEAPEDKDFRLKFEASTLEERRKIDKEMSSLSEAIRNRWQSMSIIESEL